jgi:hypothetical protein
MVNRPDHNQINISAIVQQFVQSRVIFPPLVRIDTFENPVVPLGSFLILPHYQLAGSYLLEGLWGRSAVDSYT